MQQNTSIMPGPIAPPEIEESFRNTGAKRVLSHIHATAKNAGDVRMRLENRTEMIMRQGPREDIPSDGVPEPGADAPLFAEILEAITAIDRQLQAIHEITENMDL